MKKIIFSTVLVLSLILMSVACSQQDPIVGKWGDDSTTIEFLKNGDYVFSGPYSETGTWRTLDNIKIELSSGGASMIGFYDINDNELTLVFDSEEGLFNLRKIYE